MRERNAGSSDPESGGIITGTLASQINFLLCLHFGNHVRGSVAAVYSIGGARTRVTPAGLIADALARQRGHLFLWVPVALSIGIAGYFAPKSEPALGYYAFIGGVTLLLLAGIGRLAEDWRPLCGLVALVLLGGLLAGARANLVSAPVMSYRYYGPVEGRIIGIDRSASDAVRLTLDRVVLRNMAPRETPVRVRVSLHGVQGFTRPEPGLTVILTGHLAPPPGPTEPGGFDFQRHAWFLRLGAVGYTRNPVLTLYPASHGAGGLFLHRLRMKISTAVQGSITGEAGAFAAAVITGDRAAIGQGTLADLRASNLAHLLAISGLHMGLLTGFIFAALRYALALVPFLALRLPVKKIAAVVALLAGAAYLALSGGNVATERAYVMVAVMFVAVLLDRRALTLRAVAVAAVIVLLFHPEALGQPGFQMSFAATTALVAVFGAMRNWRGPELPRYLRPVFAVVVSSAVAGAATAPFAAAHFNRVADYGLIANLMSVPLMGLAVMPGAVLAACLAPFGLHGLGLAIMAPAIRWILGVAHWVASIDGAITHVPAPSPVVLPMLSLGALWVILWQGRWWTRGAGLVPVVAAFIFWAGTDRPDLLISQTGGLIGLMTDKGRALNKGKGEGFAAASWLENDGDAGLQPLAFARGGFDGDKGVLRFQVGTSPFTHLSGRGAAARVEEACDGSAFVVLAAENKLASPACQIVDRNKLKQTGAIAVFSHEGKIKLIAARDVTGNRLWNSKAIRAGAN